MLGLRRKTRRQTAARRRRLRWWLPLAGYVAVGAYYRFRPQPRGVEPAPRTYRVPTENLRFLHNMVWYEGDQRHAVRQVVDAICEIIRGARRWVVMDVFLFNLHHAENGDFVPVTRQVVRALQDKDHPRYFITDPFNTFYGTMPCEPQDWLRRAGVKVGVVNARALQDNNLIYSPFYRLFFQWFGNGRPRFVPNPLGHPAPITARAFLEVLNFKGNHRKVVIADSGDSYMTLLTSGNLEDSGCYYAEVGLAIKSRAVARHFLASEKAVGRIAGLDIPVEVEPGPEPAGQALVTPLFGPQIKRAVLWDLREAEPGDELYVFMLFLADRDVLRELHAAGARGVRVTLVLDQSRVSFGSKKRGFPNHFAAADLAGTPNLTIRWGNTRLEEFHTKLMLVVKPDRCILHLGSANFTRRGLSGTVLEANARVEAPRPCAFSRAVVRYARWVASDPQTLSTLPCDRSLLKYLWYRIQEVTGLATF